MAIVLAISRWVIRDIIDSGSLKDRIHSWPQRFLVQQPCRRIAHGAIGAGKERHNEPGSLHATEREYPERE
jgi:hypothetical protein